ncbi:hypothetical protein BH23VER1_BH23VER1_29120 [soil metagenome]
MDWIKENKFLAGFIAVFVIGVAVLGYLLLSARTEYRTTMESYEQSSNQVRTLRARPLFPDEESLKLVESESAELVSAVDALQTKLATFQRPLNENMTDRAFQEKLTGRILEVKTLAVRRQMELPDTFALGMGTYTDTLPRSQAVPELDYELDAIEFLTTTLIRSGVAEVKALNRERLEVERAPAASQPDAAAEEEEEDTPAPEAAAGAPEAPDVVKRYPVAVSFTVTPGGLETFLNTIANTQPGSFYFVPRYLVIRNEAEIGPERGIPFEARIIEETLEEAMIETEQPDEPEEGAEGAEEGAEGAEGAEVPEETGGGATRLTDLISADEARVARVDARVIMGAEVIDVDAVIDIIRVEPVADARASDEGAPPPDGATAEAASGT